MTDTSRRPRITEETRARIIEMRATGKYTTYEIAIALDLPDQTVANALLAHKKRERAKQEQA